MSVTQSRLKSGVLTLTPTAGSAGGPTAFEAACQATDVMIKPGTDSKAEDNIEVLCGDIATGQSSATPKDTLSITAIQDWDAATAQSFSAFTWAHRGEIVAFSWKPNASSAAWTGRAKIDVPFEVGGTIGERLTSSVEWEIVELSPPSGFGTGYGHTTITGITAPTSGGKEHTFAPAGVTKPANLAALKADPVVGDSGTSKPTQFGAAEYVTLGDGSKAHMGAAAWAAGAHA